MQTIIGLTIEQATLVAWIAGALWSILFPYFRKWKESGYMLQFNPGYLVNFIITVFAGVTFSLSLYAVWVPPEAAAPFILIGAFLAAAGVDDKVLKDILKLFDFYQKIWEKTRGNNSEEAPEEISFETSNTDSEAVISS